jgi:hypothetical protein
MKHVNQLASPLQRRRGAVLLIVITLMALFTAVGLSFVYYADAEATASKLFRESTELSRPDVDPEKALAFFLGKLIYDDKDDESGIYNAARGHTIGRGIHGLDYQIQPVNGVPTVVLNRLRAPYTGTGRLHNVYNAGNGPAALVGVDDHELINYQYFAGDGFLRDPGRLYTRTDPSKPLGPYAGDFNVPYTYPDLNSLYLAAVKADGTVLTPSFHREYLFGRLDDPANPNWTNALGKYKILRPRPMDHALDANGKPLFPQPEGRFGDVQQLPGSNGPDSMWIDFGAPVMTSADGRKYKMLFAPLVIDLEGRLHLGVLGNIRGAGGVYTGNQGWGRSEVNLEQAFGAEVRKLFAGAVTPPLFTRYGPNGVPDGPLPASLPVGQWKAPVDFDGDGGAIQLPTAPALATDKVTAFPTFVGNYGNSNAAEQANHPLQFNPFAPNNDDRNFPLSNLEALLRYGDKGSPALTSDLFRLMPATFAQTRPRGLATLYSFDLRHPGLTPWVWDPADATPPPNSTRFVLPNAAPPNLFPPPDAFPTGPAIPFPKLPAPGQPLASPPGSEFDSGWRGVPPANTPPSPNWPLLNAAMTRLDLNRALPDYPVPDPTTGLIPNDAGLTTNAAFDAAQKARQDFARDIYRILIRSTGARDPNADNTVAAGTPEFQAARWLAQLAVNIVDYIDNDDYMTPFNWFGTEWVFGTEQPRLLLNEAYAQLDNDATDAGLQNADPTQNKATGYKINVWVELHNPFNPTPAGSTYPLDGGQAFLQRGTQVIYQVAVTAPNTKLADPANLIGAPDAPPPANTFPPSVVGPAPNPWGVNANQQVVLPANGAYADASQTNQGFFVLGPPQLDPNGKSYFVAGRDPNLKTTYASPAMSVKFAPVPFAAVNPTVLLQRLACPSRPFDAVANPYVTVDLMENIPANDNRDFAAEQAGKLIDPNTMAALNPAPTMRNSVGRRQPYMGAFAQLTPQNPVTPQPNQPKHTFFRHNGREDAPPLGVYAAPNAQTLDVPFTWMVHLDRQLISPMELLHVSAYRPHLLTQLFLPVTDATAAAPRTVAFKHYAPWFDNTARLYRFFEFVRTRDYNVGTENPARGPGLINLNTVWDPEILWALCNDQALGTATFAQLTNAATGRTPNLQIGPTDAHRSTPAPPSPGFPGDPPYAVNRPFRSLATGFTLATPAAGPDPQYPTDVGINNTLLRPAAGGTAPTADRLFSVAGAPHPYLQRQVLTKVFNNLTTRSNTFAVWVTVGFFEVKDDTVRPVKLGAEIGRAEGRHVRHRMFAIVDRSDMRVLNLTLAKGTVAGVATVVTNSGQPMTFTTAAGSQYSVQPGDLFVLEPNTPREETVVVERVGVDPNSNQPAFFITPAGVHPAGSAVCFRGNPGPWLNYNPHLDRGVVPYFSVID